MSIAPIRAAPGTQTCGDCGGQGVVVVFNNTYSCIRCGGSGLELVTLTIASDCHGFGQ